ncbi:TPA: ABC transporter permease subunit [Escherichia coli]|nr:ABC transporter permease subunit [Escherichia coli]
MKRSISFRPTLLALVLATNFPVAHAAVPKDMLVIGKAADPQTLDPAVTIDNNDWTVTYPSYQRLVQYKTDGDKGSTDVEGDLASSWKASDDQKEWTFTLKDNAKFADGTPVTAEAVKLSFERLLKIGQGPAEAFPKDLKIDAPDEHTVKFTLSQPFAPFLYTLANDGASIINPAVLKEHAADDARGFLAQNTAGSGPFMLKSWQKGQQLVLVPNPHYPGNKPNFKRVSVKIIGESASRRLQLSRGDIDIADALPVDQLNALKQENKVNVAEYPSLRVTYLYLNNSKAPLNQADLRRAISWSTDYQGMVNGILSGNGKQMRGPIPEGMWGYDATAMQYNHDETKAKAEWDKVTSKPTSLTFWSILRQRCWGLVLVVAGVCVITFIISHLIPGDPARLLAGDRASDAIVENIRQQLGLDQPLYVQFYRYVSDLFHGDLGTSIRTGRPVLEELRIFFPATLELAFGALLLALLIGIPLGILSAVWRNRWLDHLVRIMAITGISTPAFWLGLGVIVLFYGHLQILPGGGRLDDWLDPPTHVTGFYLLDALLEGNGEVFFNALQHLILPALTLAFVHLGIVARQIRSAMLEQLSEDYIRTARASGLPGWYIVLCYALPNALIPSITVLGLALGDLLYGAVLTETVFAWPGMGAWVVTSIQALDFPAVMGFAVVVSFAYVLVNLVVDLLYLWIDPRIGRGGGE